MSELLDPLSRIAYRREILDWRDRWIRKIESHFSNEISTLFKRLDFEIDTQMGYTDLVRSSSFTKQHIEPVYNDWLMNQLKQLNQEAQKELYKIKRQVLESTMLNLEDVDFKDYTAISGAAAAGGFLALSAGAVGVTAGYGVVSAGGIMGLIGLTTIAWPVVIAGGTAALVLGGFGLFKGSKIKDNAIEKFKEKYQNPVRERLLIGDNENPSVVDRIQESIEVTASQLLEEPGFAN